MKTTSSQRPRWLNYLLGRKSIFFILLSMSLHLSSNSLYAQFPYYTNTGARSLSMAGATIVSGEDPLAAYVNPAALAAANGVVVQVEGVAEFLKTYWDVPDQSISTHGRNLEGLGAASLGWTGGQETHRKAMSIAMRRVTNEIPYFYPDQYNTGLIEAVGRFAIQVQPRLVLGASVSYWWAPEQHSSLYAYLIPMSYDYYVTRSSFQGLSFDLGMIWEAKARPIRAAFTLHPGFSLYEEGESVGYTIGFPSEGLGHSYDLERTIELPWEFALGLEWQKSKQLRIELMTAAQLFRGRTMTTRLDSASTTRFILDPNTHLARAMLGVEYELPIDSGVILLRGGAGTRMTDIYDAQSAGGIIHSEEKNKWGYLLSAGFGLQLPWYTLDLGYSLTRVTSSLINPDDSVDHNNIYQHSRFVATLTVPLWGGER